MRHGQPTSFGFDFGRVRNQHRSEVTEDDLHDPLIEDFRRRNGLPPGGVDEQGLPVGPSDAEIKYRLLGGSALPPCPDVPLLGPLTEPVSPEFKKRFSDINCISSASRRAPPECELSRGQWRMVAPAASEAHSRVRRALARLESGIEGRRFAKDLADRLFEQDPPTPAELKQRLASVGGLLGNAGHEVFAGRTCGDNGCQQGAVAYVTGPAQLPIRICPTAFGTPRDLFRIILHEALHWSGLDADPTTPEGYCTRFDCVTPCLTGQDADGWTHYIECLGQPLETRRSFRGKILESVEEMP